MSEKEKKKRKEGEWQVGELLKCLQGSESSESCSNTRGRGPAEKVLAEQRFSKREDTELTAEFFFYLPKKRNAQAMFCVLKKLKKRATALSSPSFFSVSVISTLEDFVSALLKSCPRSPLCFAPLPSCRSVCLCACVCVCVCVCVLHAWLTVAATQMC